MNNVILMGRLTKDPELKYSQDSKAFCKFTIAVNREFSKEGADFISCTAFSKTAETIAKFFTKGKPILVQGRLQVSTYEKNGSTQWSTDVIIDKFNFIDFKSSSNESGSQNNSNYRQTEQNIDFARQNSDDDTEEDQDFPF